jgi:hypothetical protein
MTHHPHIHMIVPGGGLSPDGGGTRYLSRYTHRVAISNSRFVRCDGTRVTFRYKNYRRGGADRQQVMTVSADEFILPPVPMLRRAHSHRRDLRTPVPASRATSACATVRDTRAMTGMARSRQTSQNLRLRGRSGLCR